VPKPQWSQRYIDSWASFPAPIRRILAASVGLVTLVVGVILLVLPGPGLVVMLLGLAILATEFAWAKRSMHHVKHHGNRVARGITRKKKPNAADEGTIPNE
jgi:uncharacterized protein (TIGR02611 family)